MADTRSRKWQITINNPIEHGFTKDNLIDIISKLKGVSYYCFCDEIGLEEKTPHTHIFIYADDAIRFSTLKKKFPVAHLENCKGTCLDNRNYIRKEGKYEKDKKKETNLIETFVEWGEMPVERQGARNDLQDLQDMIKQGLSNAEIIREMPQLTLQTDKIERTRQVILEEKYKDTYRPLEVIYIHGLTGTGKTSGVLNEHGYSNVYRVTNYQKNPFDTYAGQPVILFDEFRSSLDIADMLKYLDGYPLSLPARYGNRQACYTKVYIISNISLYDQYTHTQHYEKETWNAFIRRIDKIKVYTGFNSFHTFDNIKDYAHYHATGDLPF